MELDVLKKNWRLLGEKFPNIVDVREIPALLTEVILYKATGDIVSADMSVDEFFSCLSKKVDEDGEKMFPILTRLGSSLSTIYNSSSPAERDFSLMNLIVGDPNKCRTSQLLLLSKMFITAELRKLARNCKKCKKVKERNDVSAHCHCELWIPPEDLLVTMRDGKPNQRYKLDLKEKRIEEEALRGLRELEAEDDQALKVTDLRGEIQRFQRSMADKEEKRKKMKEEKKKKKKEAKKKALKEKNKDKGKGTKRKEVSEAKKIRDGKRRRLL